VTFNAPGPAHSQWHQHTDSDI